MAVMLSTLSKATTGTGTPRIRGRRAARPYRPCPIMLWSLSGYRVSVMLKEPLTRKVPTASERSTPVATIRTFSSRNV